MNLELTESRASSGQDQIQLIAQQFTREGNIRNRILKDSPTGDRHRTMWSESRMRCWQNWYWFSSTPMSKSSFFIKSLSSMAQRLGISPEFNKLFMSSRKDSLVIQLSFIKNTDLIFLIPHGIMHFLRFSLNSLYLKSCLTSRVLNAQLLIKEASLVSVYFPLPPTPTNSALPLGYLRIRQTRAMCCKHSGNKTKSNLFVWSKLYSS